MSNLKKDTPTGAALQETDTLCPVFLRVPPEHIVFLKFILEGHEGIGIVRTLNAERADIVVLALTDTVQDLHDLLDFLKPQLQFELITPDPASLSDDWLLAEHYSALKLPLE